MKYSLPRTDTRQVIIRLAKQWLMYPTGYIVKALFEYSIIHRSTADKLAIVRNMEHGGYVDALQEGLNYIKLDQTIFSVEFIPEIDYMESYKLESQRVSDLLDAAINGDAKAAIEFCKGLRSGEIQWGAAIG